MRRHGLSACVYLVLENQIELKYTARRIHTFLELQWRSNADHLIVPVADAEGVPQSSARLHAEDGLKRAN